MRKTIQTPFVFQKRGVYYFSRRIPKDLRSHYRRLRIVVSLKTKSFRAAATRAAALAAGLEEDWLALRWKSKDDPLKRFLREPCVISGLPGAVDSPAPLLSEAKEHYVKMKGVGRSATFAQASDRAVRYLVERHGDKPVDCYSRQEVNDLRDSLYARGLAQASVKRTLSVLRAVVNFTTREHGLEEVRVFSSLYLGDEGVEAAPKRPTIPLADIRRIQAMCRDLDDEARWIIALMSDTGMRLSEAVGLLKEDVVLTGEHPHILLKGHPWRRLKTRESERVIPLVGESLWAAKRAIGDSPTAFLFPKYCDQDQCKANSASAALNKWLASRVPAGCVMHSFRHSFRDRLRAVECPVDVADRLGGWKVIGVGESYGAGYPLEVLQRWVERLV